MSAEQGWYDDPTDTTQYRFWDGERWTENTRAKDAVAGFPADGAADSAAAGQGGTAPWARSAEAGVGGLGEDAVDVTAPGAGGGIPPFAREITSVTFESDDPSIAEASAGRREPLFGGSSNVGSHVSPGARNTPPPIEIDLTEGADLASLDPILRDALGVDADGKPTKKKAPKTKKAKAAKDGKNADSKLPMLLGALAVVLIGAGAFLFFSGGDDDELPEVAGVTVTSVSTTTPDDEALTPESTETPEATDTTDAAADPTTTAAPDSGAIEAGSPEWQAITASFNAEATRACDAIKANPGLLTESVIVFDEAWAAAGYDYEQLQRSVNECSREARDTALKYVEDAELGRG